MSNTYEQLNKPDSTVQDAGLFQGQVVKTWTFIFYLQYLMDSLPYFSSAQQPRKHVCSLCQNFYKSLSTCSFILSVAMVTSFRS